jgi:uncharacterized protein
MHVLDLRSRTLGVAAGLLVVAACVAPLALAAAEDGAREIMRRVLRDSRAEDEVAQVLIELVDASGRVRRRSTTVYAKKRSAEESARLIRFHEPPDLARSAILTIEHADRDADQWIYLPAYHAARRVASANRGDTWMGTDLTYEDITDPKLEQYEYTTLREETLDGVRCTVIATVPTDRRLKEQSAYSRTIYWVDPAESVALKIEYYDRAGRLAKILTNADLRRHGAYRRWGVTRVHDLARNHRTVLTVADRAIDRGLSDEVFSVSSLERGR